MICENTFKDECKGGVKQALKKSPCPAEDMIHVNRGRGKKDLNQIYVGQVAMLAFLQSLTSFIMLVCSFYSLTQLYKGIRHTDRICLLRFNDILIQGGGGNK